jgi:hypothetical protein
MNIVIFTHDRDLAADLKRDAPLDFSVTGLTSKGAKSLGEPPLYEISIFVAGLGAKIAADVFSKWLYDKIKGRATGINAEGQNARIEESEIERCIEVKVKETHRRKVWKDGKSDA